MASSSHRNWPLTARYATSATKARFPTVRAVDPCRRRPPPKKGPFPAPATARRRLPAIFQAKVPPLSEKSRRKNGFSVEKVPFGNLGAGDGFLVLG